MSSEIASEAIVLTISLLVELLKSYNLSEEEEIEEIKKVLAEVRKRDASQLPKPLQPTDS